MKPPRYNHLFFGQIQETIFDDLNYILLVGYQVEKE